MDNMQDLRFISDGTTKVNTAGSDEFSSQHYFMSNTQVGSDFEIHKGYIKGFASDGGGLHTSKTDPQNLKLVRRMATSACF